MLITALAWAITVGLRRLRPSWRSPWAWFLRAMFAAMEMWEAEYRLGMAQAWKSAYLRSFEELRQCQRQPLQPRQSQQLQWPNGSVFEIRYADLGLLDPSIHPAIAPFERVPYPSWTAYGQSNAVEFPRSNRSKTVIPCGLSSPRSLGAFSLRNPPNGVDFDILLPRDDLISPLDNCQNQPGATPQYWCWGARPYGNYICFQVRTRPD